MTDKMRRLDLDDPVVSVEVLFACERERDALRAENDVHRRLAEDRAQEIQRLRAALRNLYAEGLEIDYRSGNWHEFHDALRAAEAILVSDKRA